MITNSKTLSFNELCYIMLLYPSPKVISRFVKNRVFPNAKNMAVLKTNGEAVRMKKNSLDFLKLTKVLLPKSKTLSQIFQSGKSYATVIYRTKLCSLNHNFFITQSQCLRLISVSLFSNFIYIDILHFFWLISP